MAQLTDSKLVVLRVRVPPRVPIYGEMAERFNAYRWKRYVA